MILKKRFKIIEVISKRYMNKKNDKRLIENKSFSINEMNETINFILSLLTKVFKKHTSEKLYKIALEVKNKIKENEPNVIDPEGIRHGMSPVAGWVGGKKKRWGRRQRMCVRGVDERPPNHPLQVASLSLSLVTHIPLQVGAKAHCLGGCLE